MSENQHQNDYVKFTVHQKPHCIVEYEVDAFSPLVKRAHQKALREVGKHVVVPGFRKGKAPLEMIEGRHTAEIDRKWQEQIANEAFKECYTLSKIPMLRNDGQVSFKMHSHSKEGAKLTLFFETLPHIPTIDPKQLTLQHVKRPEVNADKVRETIRQTQLFFAEWHPIHGRAIQEGDFLILDVDVYEKEGPKRLFDSVRFEVTDRTMAKWMKELVLHKEVGQTLEGLSEPDADLPEEEKKAFEPKKVKVHIRTMENPTFPPLDDAFAQRIGVENVSKLEERIEQHLKKQADDHVKDVQREQVSNFLLNHYPFDLPRSMIERETQFRLRQMATDPSFESSWNRMSDTDRRQMVNQVMTQSEKAVRLFYLCRKIVSDAGLTLSASDVPQPSVDPLEVIVNPTGHQHDPRQPDIKQAEAFSRLLLEKAEDWLIAEATKESSLPLKEGAAHPT